MIFAQSALVSWRKRHRRSYDLATLVGLWLIPPVICLYLGLWRFLTVRASAGARHAAAVQSAWPIGRRGSPARPCYGSLGCTLCALRGLIVRFEGCFSASAAGVERV